MRGRGHYLATLCSAAGDGQSNHSAGALPSTQRERTCRIHTCNDSERNFNLVEAGASANSVSAFFVIFFRYLECVHGGEVEKGTLVRVMSGGLCRGNGVIHRRTLVFWHSLVDVPSWQCLFQLWTFAARCFDCCETSVCFTCFHIIYAVTQTCTQKPARKHLGGGARVPIFKELRLAVSTDFRF